MQRLIHCEFWLLQLIAVAPVTGDEYRFLKSKDKGKRNVDITAKSWKFFIFLGELIVSGKYVATQKSFLGLF